MTLRRLLVVVGSGIGACLLLWLLSAQWGETPAPSLGYIDDAGVRSYSQVQRAWEKSASMSGFSLKSAAL